MKIVKKSQVIIFVIALMLIAAGYLNYTSTDTQNSIKTNAKLSDSEEYAAIGDARLVSGNAVEETNEVVENKVQNNVIETSTNEMENKTKEEMKTNSEVEKDDYFTTSKMQRDTMYSQSLESYQKILENSTISSEQKQISQNEIKNINDTKNAIMITENLIKTKGFKNVIILKNDKSINVIIETEKLSPEEIAQIQNIVSREMKAQIEDIHISER